MDGLIPFRLLILIIASVGAFVYKFARERGQIYLSQIVLFIFSAYATANILLLVFFWVNHNAVNHFVLLEGSFLEHIRRAASGQPIYTEPSPGFIPFAYQPLYYYLVVPLVWIFGLKFSTARVVSILGTTGALILVFLVIRKRTGSSWWGVMVAGLFAAAYSIFDNALEGLHPDAWFLFSVLIGCYLMDQKHSMLRNSIGMLFIVLAFWFKQHGAIFAVGALLYLSLGENWRKALFYWALAIVLGPVLYISIPDWLFGPYYHYYTWEVPRHWTEFNFDTIRRFGGFVIKYYPVLSVLALGVVVSKWIKLRFNENIWYFMFPFAVASGFLGALDPGSSNNVFISMGVWFIIVGTIGLKELVSRFALFERWGLHLILLGITFAVFLYNPFNNIILSPRVELAYRDLVSYLDSLDGPVYAPWIGQLPDTDKLYPSANWVALEDIIRGPGVNEYNHPVTRKILEPLLNPKGTAYILMNYPLEDDPMLGFLADYYVLDQDLGERFVLLRPINPARWNLMWPRYLYKHKDSR